ncbi:myb-like protein AA [Condylostylus longicornis]|uniref:myb-like protein AA n=1 Tax=Condylostylus longicornis TaxID=2530218 RepID=UPI00244E0E2A|nr:myb-like protein AA [Condylostylus longicornis]
MNFLIKTLDINLKEFYNDILQKTTGSQLIYSITVSPDSNIKNATNSKIIRTHDNIDKTIKLNSDKTANLTKSINLADRNRRLIPYMTFYIPTDDENYDAINQQQQYDSPQQQSNHHLQQSHQLNHDLYQQSETQEQGKRINENDNINSEGFIQNQQQHQPTYLTNEHQPNDPLYVHQMRISNRPHLIHGFQPSPSNLYDNVRQQVPLNLLKKGVVNQSQLQHHHQLLHQNQQQQQQLKHEQQESNVESHLPQRENLPKYNLYHSHHINHQILRQQQQQHQHSKLAAPTLTNPILLKQEQPQSNPDKLHSSPFTPFNKIPGQFTPILYINEPDAKNVNYHNKLLIPISSPSPQPSIIATTAATIVSSNESDDNENKSDNRNNNNDVPVKQLLNSNQNDENPEQNIQFYNLKTIKPQQQQQQRYNYQQQELQNSQHQEQQHQHQIYKYPVEHVQNSDEVIEQQRLSPYHYHNPNHQNNNQKHQTHNYNQHKQQQNTNEETDNRHIIALVPLQKQHNLNHQQHEERLQQNHQNTHQQIQHEQEQHLNQQQHLKYDPNDIKNVQNIVSTTQRPTYKLVTEIAQKYKLKHPQATQQPLPTSVPESEMTPQERYVAYLQQQLRLKHQNRYKEHQQPKAQSLYKNSGSHPNVQQIDPYLISVIPSPNPPENYLYPTEKQKQQHQYPNYIYPPKVEIENNDNSKKIIYMRPQQVQHGSRYSTQAPHPGNYLQLLDVETTQYQPDGRQPQGSYKLIPIAPQLQPSSTPQTIFIPLKHEVPQHQLQPVPPVQKDAKLKQFFFVTTAKPILITSKNPNYNYETVKTSQSIESTTAPASPIYPSTETSISGQKFPNIKETASLAEILRKLQETNHLPHTITPDNIDNSIKTLIKILNNLKQSQTIIENPPQHHEHDYNDYDDTGIENIDPSKPGPNSGRPGVDYPNLAEIPPTSFNCKEQRYKGFFGDPETNCQVWHYCDLNGGQASFLCPNGTIFSQVALTCDWWFNVKCSTTPQLYVLNERLYKYILPFTPKFPEDYSGPLVDKYLALKFKEMEEKMNRERENESKEEENAELNKPEINEEITQDSTATEKHPKSASVDPNEEPIIEQNNSNLKQQFLDINNNGEEVKSVNLVDVEENRGAVDTGITYNTYSTSTTTEYPLPSSSLTSPPPLTVKPIYVPSTTPAVYSSTYSDLPSSNVISSTPISAITASNSNIDLRNLKLKHQNRLRLRQRLKSNRNRQNINRKPKVDVESEKVEVIEIKTDGSSGHIIPNLQEQQNNQEQEQQHEQQQHKLQPQIEYLYHD